LKRLAVPLTALAILAAAAAAYAGIDTYSASISFTSKHAGTPSKPVAIGYTEDLKVTAPTATAPESRR
jgi:polyisoprenoid-binding protein YceI